MRIAMMTGGGDAPGLNAVIRGITYRSISYGFEVLGAQKGWAGVLNGDFRPLTMADVEDIHRQGGTILGTSRTPLFPKKEGDPDRSEEAVVSLRKAGIDALVAIGGEDTLGEAMKLHKSSRFPNTIGVPKTIDNDVNATDYCFGYNTAITRAMEAIDGLHTTSRSHHRVTIVEVMGRHAGWMTLEAGMAGGAHYIVLPEEEFDTGDICKVILERYRQGKTYAIIAVSEGASDLKLAERVASEREEARKACEAQGLDGKLIDSVVGKVEYDSFGHPRLGGIGKLLEKEIESRLKKEIEEMVGPYFKFEARSVLLGHLQRGGAPTVFDRVLGTRLGLKAADLIHEGAFGQMVSLRGTDIVNVSLEEGVGTLKTVPACRYEEAKVFFG